MDCFAIACYSETTSCAGWIVDLAGASLEGRLGQEDSEQGSCCEFVSILTTIVIDSRASANLPGKSKVASTTPGL